MIKKLLIPIFVLAILPCSAQFIGVQFAESLTASSGVSDYVDIVDVSTNANGAIFVGGQFTGTVDFDPSPTNTVTRIGVNNDIYLGRYTSQGALLNSSSIIASGDAQTQTLKDIAVRGQSVYIIGDNEGVATFSTGLASTNVVGTNGNLDILIAKFDEGLSNIWAYSIGGAENDTPGGLTVDNSGNMYITGLFRGSVNFDPSGNGTTKTLTAGTDGDIFIAKYNTNGELIWVNQIGGSFFDVGVDLELDGNGNLYVTGRFNGTVDFDPGAGVSSISANANDESTFIAKYTTDGNYVWAKSIIGVENVADMSLSYSGKIAIVGYYQLDNADVDPGVGEALLPYDNNLPDGYLSVYDNDGNFLWAKSIGGPESSLELMESVYFLEDESIIISGGGGGSIQFNQGEANPVTRTANSSDGLIAKYDVNGAVVFAYMLGGSGSDYNTALTLDGGNLFAYGRIRSPSIDFDPSDGMAIVTSANEDDAYLVKYDVTGPQLVKNNTAESATFGNDLTVNIEVEDEESGVQSVALDYRGISSLNAAPFKRITLTNKSGNQYEGTIPSDDFDELGIEFRGFAVNDLGVESTSAIISRPLSVPDGLTIPQYGSGNGSQEDYRIIAVPLQLNSATVKSIFEDDLGPYDPNEYRLFGYTDQTRELTANSTLEPGRGYWLIVAGNDREMNTGAGRTVAVSKTSAFTLALNAGWNLIGNPYYFNIGWTEMKAANPGIGDLRIYDGSFSNGTVLDAMTGGFLFTDTESNISFPVIKNPALNNGRNNGDKKNMRRPELQPGDWEVLLNLAQQDHSYALGGIGMRKEAKSDFDKFDNMSLPRFGEYLELNHEKEFLGFNYSLDIVPPAIEKSWEFTVESALSGKTTISWNPAHLSDLNGQLILLDIDNEWPVDMVSQSSYTFESNGVRHFKAIYGGTEFIKQELSAEKFVFHGIYPNPAHERLNVSFSIPEPSDKVVTLTILNTMGQVVQKSSWQSTETGLTSVGLPLSVAPGMYIVQVQLGNIQKQTRVLVR